MPGFLQVDNERLWLLIGLCVAMIVTIEAVEESVQGVWPHQRRPSRMTLRARSVHAVWGYVALLLLPGMLLAILNIGTLLWRDVPYTDAQLLGGFFLGLGWLLFVAVSVDLLRLGRYMADLGLVGPAALIVLLLVGDGLLLIGLLDVVPSLDAVREALPGGL